MKIALVFATVIAAATAQFGGFGQQFGAFGSTRSPPRPAPVRYQPQPSAPKFGLLPTTPAPFAPLPTAAYKPSVATVSRVSSNDQNANVLRYDNDIGPDGSYSYALEIDNGIAAKAEGVPRPLGGNPPVVPVVSQGSFSWTSPDGQPISITYVADENGYQASGDAIPTPPPIPEAILRSLEYNARNPQQN